MRNYEEEEEEDNRQRDEGKEDKCYEGNRASLFIHYTGRRGHMVVRGRGDIVLVL